MRVLIVIAMLGCGVEPTELEQPDAGMEVDHSAGDTQLPPTNRAALDTWLAAGHYKSWRCEPFISTPRPGSAHSRARICSNAALSTADLSTIPVGAASVKELYDSSDQLRGYAVSRKLGATKSDWYWYEKYGSSTYADGINVGLCANCHSGASSEHTFVIVR